MEGQEKTWQAVQQLLDTERFAVLATQSETGPHASLVAFWAAEDLTYLAFPTMRSTRKFRYLVAHPRVALLVDNRCGRTDMPREITALTVTGTARELTDQEALVTARKSFLARHPALAEFLSQPDCALVKVVVDTYYLVTDLQVISELPVPGHSHLA